MGLSYEERLALRAHLSRDQLRRFRREKRMNLFDEWDGYRRGSNVEGRCVQSIKSTAGTEQRVENRRGQ